MSPRRGRFGDGVHLDGTDEPINLAFTVNAPSQCAQQLRRYRSIGVTGR